MVDRLLSSLRLLNDLLLDGLELAQEVSADGREVGVGTDAQARGLDSNASDARHAGGQAGGVVLLVEEADEGEAQGADLGLETGIGGGALEGAAQAVAEEGIVVAGTQPLAKASEDGSRVVRFRRGGVVVEREVAI
jgi:hypothetical protein